IFGQGTGSTADYLSRYIAQKLTERWGQPVIVDSRAGAGGTIPTDVVAKSPPDGYNLVMGHIGPMVSAVTLYAKSLPYDPVRDFEPVTMVAQGVVVLVTHPSVPVASPRNSSPTRSRRAISPTPRPATARPAISRASS